MAQKEKTIIITQKRSTIRGHKRHLATLKSLGLGKIGRSAVHKADASIIGMVRTVAHLVEVREQG